MTSQPSTSQDLVASFYTLSGAPNGEPARHAFIDRLHAAKAAGWAGIGLAALDYQSMLQSHQPDELLAMTADADLPVAEIEFLPFDLARADGRPSEQELVLYGMADLFGSRQLNATLGGTCSEEDEPQAARCLGAVADAAADHGLVVALEFMPFAAVKTINQALRIVERADRSNAGVLVDAYHFFRGGSSLDALRAAGPELIAGVQLDDAPADAPEDLLSETRTSRLLPGEGGLDLVGMLRAIATTGADVPIGVELLSTKLQALDIDDLARRTYQSTAAVCAASSLDTSSRS